MSQHEIVDEAASKGITMEPRTISEGPTAQGIKPSDIKWLDLSRTVIEQKEKKMLARALESNELPNLKVLFLEGNAGDAGMMAMLNALHAGYLKGLEKFILWEVSSYDQITTAEEGTDTIAAALTAGNLPNLDTMDLTGSLPKLIPARKFSKAMREFLFGCSCGTGRLLEGLQVCMGCLFCTTDRDKNQTLECLRCWFGGLQVYSGDDGIRKIGGALRITPINNLKVLRLQNNYIRDRGASSLAKILRRGLMPNLDELDLRHNPVGYEGAKKIVFAYLRNPLLTVRVRLDWPTLLLQGKAGALRDANIRLEHRLKKLEIPHESLVINEYIELDHYLKRYHRAGTTLGCFQRHRHRLHLLCQAQNVRGRRFKSHEVMRREGADREPAGIEIRNRSMFRHSSAQQKIMRDLDSDSSDEEAGGQEMKGWLSSGDESDESPVVRDGVDGGELFEVASVAHSGEQSTAHSVALSTMHSRANSEFAYSGDEMTEETLGRISHHLKRHRRVRAPFLRTPNRSSLKRKKTVLKRRTGVNRIYINSKSCGFVGAAKALGNQLGGRDSSQKRSWLPTWIDRNLRRRFWPWQSRSKTERQMDSIKMELLMLGERKPDEFYSIFGLRQVLLLNRNYRNKYSRVWICNSCFLGYSMRRAVHPITTDDEIKPKDSSDLDQFHHDADSLPDNPPNFYT